MEDIKHTFVVLAYKESEYLENSIQSVLNQEYPSKVVIGTSTRNEYIEKMAEKYNLPIIENAIKGGGNAVDFDFAWNVGKTELVTIAHQDDQYDPTYSKEIVEAYEKNPKATILFTDYYEVRDGKRVYENRLLNVKRVLLSPLKVTKLGYSIFWKRRVLSFGDSICCPAVTFVPKNIPFKSVFQFKEFNGVSDWAGWVKLANIEGAFIYVPKPLMGHRVHEESHTSREINSDIRSKQELIMFKKFWPTPIAKVLNRAYRESQKSNIIK
ncbi:MAG: glycosyltransferase [Erysipelotrichaceae bacterium]|nr:glycosyltransferase [Erysipelotrichaceae bacterium]